MTPPRPSPVPYRSAVPRSRYLLSLVLFAVVLAGCVNQTTYRPRPYRYDARANVAQETQRLAQRMSGRTDTRPAFVDPSSGTIYAAWRMTGVSTSIRMLPPGEKREWLLVRYRAHVRPNGAGSSVYVDLEQMRCDSSGFSWTELVLTGDCHPVTQVTASQLRALDEVAASLRN